MAPNQSAHVTVQVWVCLCMTVHGVHVCVCKIVMGSPKNNCHRVRFLQTVRLYIRQHAHQ